VYTGNIKVKITNCNYDVPVAPSILPNKAGFDYYEMFSVTTPYTIEPFTALNDPRCSTMQQVRLFPSTASPTGGTIADITSSDGTSYV